MKERLKREISIQRLAEARGIKLRRVGKELIGLCPFHDDRNPSLNIDPVKNVWSCKGACGEGGDVIRWVARMEGVSDGHAIALLKKDYAPSSGPVVKQSTVPKLPCPVTLGGEDRAVLLEVVRFYGETLRETVEAKRYLEKRGLKSAEMLKRFQLGFSDRMLGPALPDRNRLAGAEVRGQLERLGIVRTSGHEHLRGSLVIPVMNLEGDVVQLYGRKINDNLRTGTDYHLYLPGPMRGVWNEEAFVASKEIILCESLIDALTFWCAGYRNVTASYGVNGFTKDHRAAFERHGTKRVYIAYDSDEAGNKAAVKLAAERWMSPDWADKPEAVPYSDLANPQSLNLYGYVKNNPLRSADPDGHEDDGDPQQTATAPHPTPTVPNPTAAEVDASLARTAADTAAADAVGEGVLAAGSRLLGGVVGFFLYAPTMNEGPNDDCHLCGRSTVQPTPGAPVTPKPQDSSPPSPTGEHDKGARPSTKDKHEKVRPGTSPPPNYKPDRKFKQPEDDKKKDAKPPYVRKDRDKPAS